MIPVIHTDNYTRKRVAAGIKEKRARLVMVSTDAGVALAGLCGNPDDRAAIVLATYLNVADAVAEGLRSFRIKPKMLT